MTYLEMDAEYGHDTFLLDLNNVGTAIKVNAALVELFCVLLGYLLGYLPLKTSRRMGFPQQSRGKFAQISKC